MYYSSDGKGYSQKQIDRRIAEAGRRKLLLQKDEYGYHFCEVCGVNEIGAGRMDVAHLVSRQQAKNERRTELCWDLENLRVMCRRCHRDYDKN